MAVASSTKADRSQKPTPWLVLAFLGNQARWRFREIGRCGVELFVNHGVVTRRDKEW